MESLEARMHEERRRFLFHGFVMLTAAFALGVVAGALGKQHHPSARLWLGAHLTGISVGTLLCLLGVVRPHLQLGRRASAAFFWSAVGGNWVGLLVLGVFSCLVGAGTPILNPTLAPPSGWQGAVIAAALLLVTVTTFVFCGLGIYGARRPGSGAGV
jgi:hypothetical protein